MTDPSQLSNQQLQALYAQMASSTGNSATSPPAPNSSALVRSPIDGSPGTASVGQNLLDPRQLSDSEIQSIYRGQTDPVYDMGHSFLPGLAQGAAGLLNSGADLINAAHPNLAQENATRAANQAHLASEDPWSLRGIVDQFAASQDTGIRHYLPGSQGTNAAIQSVTGPYYQPQTAWGRAGQTVGQMAPAALLPGSMGARLARALIPAATSEGAGEAARSLAPGNTTAEALARGLGGVAGGMGLGAGEAIANAPMNTMAKVMGGASPEAVGNIKTALATAANLPGGGIMLTPAEAAAQVGVPGMARIQHFVENTPQGAAKLDPFFAKRPDQVSSVTNAMADALAPPRSDPSMLGLDVQKASQGALDTVRQGINAQANPYYQALREEQMGPIFANALKSDPSYSTALDNVRSNPELNGPVASLPDGNLAVVNEAVKNLDTSAIAAKQTVTNPGGNNALAALRTAARSRADTLASLLSDNWRNARDTVAQGRAALLDPLAAGPLGATAATDQFPAQSTALMRPQNVGGAAETAQAMGHISGQDPALPPQIVAQYLRNSAEATNGALRNLNGGQNQWGGAGLATRIAAAPEQRQAFLGAAEAAQPGSSGVLSGFLDSLAATGKRIPVGSRTAFSDLMANEMGVPHEGFSSWTDPLTYGKMINNAVGGALYKSKINALADFLGSGDQAAQGAFLDRAQSLRNPGNGLATTAIGANLGARR